jgi:hypothetical protein
MVVGTVTSVDVYHHACEVKTDFGQKLTNVQWLLPTGGSSRTGSHITPTVNDRVLINFSLSYAIIIGFLPKVDNITCSPVQINSGIALGDPASNLSTLNDSTTRVSPGRPEDIAVGDHVWTSEGGGLMGLLRGGTVLLRSSRLAQIIISRIDHLVRIVGRNYEVFTDAFIDASYNLKGRIYRFTGYAENHTKVRGDNYSYREYKGDVALAEFAEGNGFVPATYNGTYPAANNTIRKVKVIQGGTTVYEQILDLDGHKKDTNTHGGGDSYIDQTGAQIQVSVGTSGASVATLNGSSIVLDQGSNGVITLTNSSITLDQIAGGRIVMDASGIDLRFAGHFVTIDSTGVHTG